MPADKPYPMDIDRAFRKLDEIKPHIKVWWTQGNQSQQLIRDGEVDMIGMWNARAQELIDKGAPLTIVWNGAESYGGYWFVPKGTPNSIIAKLNQSVVGALGDATVRRRLADLGQELPTREQQTSEALRSLQKADIEKWWPIIKAANVKGE